MVELDDEAEEMHSMEVHSEYIKGFSLRTRTKVHRYTDSSISVLKRASRE